jgi:hypothetical protein
MAAKTVKLATDVMALAEPTFLIQDGKRVYVTVAVLEYAPDKAKPGRQAKDVARLTQMFDGIPENPRVSVRKLKRGDLISVQTEPPGVQTGPGPGPIGPLGGPGGKPPGGRAPSGGGR